MGGAPPLTTFIPAAPPQLTTDDPAMNDGPKIDYEALLAELRERAKEVFPGWAAFLAEWTDETVDEAAELL